MANDIWEYLNTNVAIIIPTNGRWKDSGEAVMGAGLAESAAKKFPELPLALGDRLQAFGNQVYWFPEYKILTFPTKDDWKQKSKKLLIVNSAHQVVNWYNKNSDAITGIAVPKVGCGLGGLNWSEVKPILKAVWSDAIPAEFIIYVE